ncbi:WD40-repeat-containing domain protein [Cyathus striatus]|nr:WD40-repeat-containing domain protein [Cyathus striatus]
MRIQETVLCTISPSATNPGPGFIAIHDIGTGASLATFKQTNSPSNCTAFHNTRDAQGGFVLAAQRDRSIINVYTFQKDQIHLKIVLPEKLTCTAVDDNGDYCAGGTAQGRIYLWEIASGILYNVWDAHYRQVNVLRFTRDGAALVSGSDDSGVSVWSVARLVDDSSQSELPAPYCTLSDHTLPITDIVCGVGPFPKCRILTSSVDHSVKVWDLSSRALLTSFQFPQPISFLAWDITERLFFAASANGSVHQVNMFQERESKFGDRVMEAIGEPVLQTSFAWSMTILKQRKRGLFQQPISAITISLTSSLLLIGTTDGLIYLYDIVTHQLLRTISAYKGFFISYLATMLKPPDLIGHIDLNLKVGSAADAKDVIPVKPLVPFHRIRDEKARSMHEVSMLLPAVNATHWDESSCYSEEELLRDYAFFMDPTAGPVSGSGPNPTALTSRVGELEAEVESLRTQLSKAKGVNDKMWDTVVQRLIGKDEENGLEEVDGQRRRKRGRGM